MRDVRPNPPLTPDEVRAHWRAWFAMEISSRPEGAWSEHPLVRALIGESMLCPREQEALYDELICESRERWVRQGGQLEPAPAKPAARRRSAPGTAA